MKKMNVIIVGAVGVMFVVFGLYVFRVGVEEQGGESERFAGNDFVIEKIHEVEELAEVEKKEEEVTAEQSDVLVKVNDEKEKVSEKMEGEVVEERPMERREKFEMAIEEFLMLAKSDDPIAFIDRLIAPSDLKRLKEGRSTEEFWEDMTQVEKDVFIGEMEYCVSFFEKLQWEELEWLDEKNAFYNVKVMRGVVPVYFRDVDGEWYCVLKEGR